MSKFGKRLWDDDGLLIESLIPRHSAIDLGSLTAPLRDLFLAGDLDLKGGLALSEAVDGRMGEAVLVGGTVTIANTSITADTRILLSRTTTGGTEGTLSSVKTAGVDFDINSSSGTDTSTVLFVLLEPAA